MIHPIRDTVAAALAAVLVLVGCQGVKPRSDASFDEINQLVQGKRADQVIRLLGEPDTRRKVFDADERWIWWNYTFLDGNDHPPEVRGRVVHLEIVFKNPAQARQEPRPYTEWPVDGEFAVSYKMPSHGG